jgi:hypothetical protein
LKGTLTHPSLDLADAIVQPPTVATAQTVPLCQIVPVDPILTGGTRAVIRGIDPAEHCRSAPVAKRA